MGGGWEKKKSRPLYQTQPEVYGKVKWMATSERVNLLYIIIERLFSKDELHDTHQGMLL